MTTLRVPEISVVICTLNRDEYLRRALDSLAKQSLARERFEVVLVDNGGAESTRQLAENFSPKLNVRYLTEPSLGLAHARNAGWQAAQSLIIAFLDDDCIATPQWLEKILNTLHNVKPTPVCVGGNVLPIWEVPRPPWISDHLLKYLSMITKDEEPQWIHRPFLVGANLVVFKNTIDNLGGFNTELGRKGRTLLSGEETLMLERVLMSGGGCFYDPGIVVGHHVVADRLKRSWFIKRAFWGGASHAIIETQMHLVSSRARAKTVLRSIARALAPQYLARLTRGPNHPDCITELTVRAYAIGIAYGHVATWRRARRT